MVFLLLLRVFIGEIVAITVIELLAYGSSSIHHRTNKLSSSKCRPLGAELR